MAPVKASDIPVTQPEFADPFPGRAAKENIIPLGRP